ncbi:MAG: hypothetical protein HQL46_05555 [Gammaproteobacteria bacterium]|nr:hypothetical protein [Gammaproteobacteria bacterium]
MKQILETFFTPKLMPKTIAVIIFLIAYFYHLLRLIISVEHTTGITSSSGYLMVPVDALIYGLPWLFIGLSLGYTIKSIRTKKVYDFFISIILVSLSLVYIYHVVLNFSDNKELIDTVNDIHKMDTQMLDDFVTQSPFKNNKFALGAISLNPNTSSLTLEKIVANNNIELHKKMSTEPELIGNNLKGLAVMRLIIRHPNVNKKILLALSKSTDSDVLGDIAEHIDTPPSVLIELYQSKKDDPGFYLIEWGLAANINTPSTIFQHLSESRNEYTLRRLKSNQSLSKEIKQYVLKRISTQDYDKY